MDQQTLGTVIYQKDGICEKENYHFKNAADFEVVKKQFLLQLSQIVAMEEICPELILNCRLKVETEFELLGNYKAACKNIEFI